MIDQVIAETLSTLHPDTLAAGQATDALRDLMAHYATEQPADVWAAMVSSPLWREDRPEMLRALAVADWNGGTDQQSALVMAELHVMAIEAVAALWTPEQCWISAVRIDGRLRVSLVCSL